MQYILPLIVSVIYLKGYYDIFAAQRKTTLILWMCFACAMLIAIFGISIFTGRKKQNVK